MSREIKGDIGRYREVQGGRGRYRETQGAGAPRASAGCTTERVAFTASGRASTCATTCAAACTELRPSKSSPGASVTWPPTPPVPRSSLPTRTWLGLGFGFGLGFGLGLGLGLISSGFELAHAHDRVRGQVARRLERDLLLGGTQLVELAEEVAHRPRHLRAAQRACEMQGDIGETYGRHRGDIGRCREI